MDSPTDPLLPSTPASLAPPADNWRHAISFAPRWYHRYLVARSFCDDEEQTARRTHISKAIIYREVDRNPTFAKLRQDAIERQLQLGNDDSSQIAREGYANLVQHFLAEAVDPKNKLGAQVQAGRLIGETAGVVGQPSQVNVQVNTQTVAAEQWRLYQEVIVGGRKPKALSPADKTAAESDDTSHPQPPV